MNSRSSFAAKFIAEKGQLIKWSVYTLLIINFVFYIRDDWHGVIYTMRNGGSFLDWTAAFATTIDETAWLVLLVLFELETYTLSDNVLDGPMTWIIRGARILCYVLLFHTLYAYGTYVHHLLQVSTIPNITDLCQLAEKNISFAMNLEYTPVNHANCAALSTDSQFSYIDSNLVVTDSRGLTVERHLAWVDYIDAATWLCIVFIIELTVQLQDRGITRGWLLSTLNTVSLLLYMVLWGAIAYWIYKGHWFAWDEALWIAGFAVIEMNISDWRQAIDDADNPETLIRPVIKRS